MRSWPTRRLRRQAEAGSVGTLFEVSDLHLEPPGCSPCWARGRTAPGVRAVLLACPNEERLGAGRHYGRRERLCWESLGEGRRHPRGPRRPRGGSRGYAPLEDDRRGDESD